MPDLRPALQFVCKKSVSVEIALLVTTIIISATHKKESPRCSEALPGCNIRSFLDFLVLFGQTKKTGLKVGSAINLETMLQSNHGTFDILMYGYQFSLNIFPTTKNLAIENHLFTCVFLNFSMLSMQRRTENIHCSFYS